MYNTIDGGLRNKLLIHEDTICSIKNAEEHILTKKINDAIIITII